MVPEKDNDDHLGRYVLYIVTEVGCLSKRDIIMKVTSDHLLGLAMRLWYQREVW